MFGRRSRCTTLSGLLRIIFLCFDFYVGPEARYSFSALLHIEKYLPAGMKIQLDHEAAAVLPV